MNIVENVEVFLDAPVNMSQVLSSQTVCACVCMLLSVLFIVICSLNQIV